MTNNRFLSYGLIARAALLVQATITAALAWAAPSSLAARLVATGGSDAHVALLLFSICTLAASLDLLINDIAPAKFTAKPLRRNRHLVYSLLGACYFVNVFAGASPQEPIAGAEVLLTAYAAFGLTCMWYSTVCALRGRTDAY